MTPSGVRVRAPAKVNLTLHVGARRPDGFHEVDTLFQAIDLADRVEVRWSDAGGGVTLDLDGPDLGPVEDNLAVRAAAAFRRAADLDRGVRIRLVKHVPAGAGLGGGSSDAAAVLRALDHLAGRPLPASVLRSLAGDLGSDVPFFLGDSPLARGRGRGERLVPCRPLPPAWLVLVLPPVHVATGPAYEALAEARRGNSTPAPPVDPDVGSWASVVGSLHNDFEAVVAAAHPRVAASLAMLREVGASPALLSGSGGACFGWSGREDVARAAASDVEARLGWPARPVRTLRAFPGVEPLDGAGG